MIHNQTSGLEHVGGKGAVPIILGAIILSLSLPAQQRTAARSPRATFEVASVKANRDCTGDQQYQRFSPGRIGVSCIALRNLIQVSYGRYADGVRSNGRRLPVYGLPGWANSDKFDIIATAPSNTPIEQMFGPMVQALLEDRFNLKVHYETRELPVYLMTVAKGGLKIQLTKRGACTPIDLSHANEPSPNFCGRMTQHPEGSHMKDDAIGMPMSDIASRFLSNRLDRPVIDKTGVEGIFDAHLEFDNTTEPNDGNSQLPVGPSLFTATQEQLGLKLKADKGPVEVLVIDHVEKPSEN